jgi:DNA polymerase
MIIGEAPGKQEDIQGRPFVGRAGRFLRSCLENASIPLSSVYITNTVKCRPPENRQPKEQEWKTCTYHYLWKQIELINPKIICLMGGTALRAILGIKSIRGVKGKKIEKNGRLYWATYHPAAALYNVRYKDVITKDIRKLGKFLDAVDVFERKRKTVFSSRRQ